jgi:hypothetical protein
MTRTWEEGKMGKRGQDYIKKPDDIKEYKR